MKLSLLISLLMSYFVLVFCQEDTSANELTAKVTDVFLGAFENTTLPPGIPPINISSVPSAEDADRWLQEKCTKNTGNESYAENMMMAKENLGICVQTLVNYTELQMEIEAAKPYGELDLVFAKYCGKSPIFKECATNFTKALDPCLEPKEKETKAVLQNGSESLLNFICHREGERIALFIAEGGPECISDKKEAIIHCMTPLLAKFMPKGEEGNNNTQIPVLKLENEECTIMKEAHTCVVAELEKCNLTTPSNIVDALMKYVIQQTPCKYLYPNENSSSSVTSMTFILVVGFMVTRLW